MPADSDPMDPTSYSTTPPAASLSADDVVSHLRAIAAIPPGQQSLWDCTVAAWAADELVAREKALDGLDSCLRDIGRVVGYEAGCDAHEVLVRVRKALEALTAERQSLREACVSFLGSIAYVEADGAYYVTTDQADALEAAVRSTPNAPVADNEGWYASHRRRVEAAHAAATKAAKADRLWDAPMEDVIAAILPALAAQATKADAGIDMELLGELCREEPDEATKREVAAMMDGIRAPNDSPLSDPGYPELVKMARESAKGGD